MEETVLRDQLAGYAGEELHEPTDQELAEPLAAPGRSAALPMGVMYQASWQKRSDGIARHAREQARALALYMPVHLTGTGSPLILDSDIAPEVIESVGYLRHAHAERYPCAIRHIVLGSREHLAHTMCPAGARLVSDELQERVWASSVLYTSIERDRIAPELIEDLGRVGQVWVPCESNRQALYTSGMPLDKIHVVPYPYDPATHETTRIPAPRGSEQVPRGKRFYTIGKWEPRKGLHELIGAFLLAFTPKDHACLTIKTFGWGKWKNYPSPQESGAHWAAREWAQAKGWTAQSMARLIRVIDDELTNAEIADLHKQNNIYVSASHGEAWNIPAFDARCAGNALVHVGYGGSEMYAMGRPPSEHCYTVPYQMGPVHEDYGWEPGAQWAHYERDDFVNALRKAEPPELRRHPPGLAPRFSRVAVGLQMRDLLLQMLDTETAYALRYMGHYG